MTSQLTVEEHYGSKPLIERVNDALKAAGLTDDHVSWETLSPLDQFHTHGLIATKELGAALAIREGATVLDVGSGIGGSARFLAATYSCNVIGIDLTPAIVDVATMLSERAGLSERTKFRQADALALPFDDEAFDYAWTQHVAMNIQNRAQFYSEIHRVLKPGGRLGIHDIVAGSGEPLIYPVPWALTPEINFLLTGDEMRRALVHAGFQEVTWVDATNGTLAWFDERRSTPQSPGQPPPLGIQVVMGPEIAGMVVNLERNFREGRVRVIQAVVARD